MKSSIFGIVIGLVWWGLGSGPAAAATPTASFGVTATVEATCMVSASATITQYARRNGTVAVSVTCSHVVPYYVDLTGELANRITLATHGLSFSGSASWNATLVSTVSVVSDRNRVADVDSVDNSRKTLSQTPIIDVHILATPRRATGAFVDTIIAAVTY